jgi:hypothetical protein
MQRALVEAEAAGAPITGGDHVTLAVQTPLCMPGRRWSASADSPDRRFRPASII